MPAADFSFIILDSVDSTNNYAMAKIHAGMAKHGDAFFAYTQTGGKGQRGKIWQTGSGENIALSLVIAPEQLKQADQFNLSAVIALYCAEFFRKYAVGEVKIKWPNDIYWRDRKAGGILIETVLRGTTWKWAVAGIGININQARFSDDLKNPVSLKQITGKDFDVVEMARELQLLLLRRAEELKAGSAGHFLKLYNEQLYKLNETVKFSYQGEVLEGIIKGVNANGQLIVLTDREMAFDFGLVEWLL